jgi:ABC-type Fe3+/spermidine/putrescine transport system ATPase subunit
MPSIEVRDLVKCFGPNRVLKSLSFSVQSGEYVIVLGPSGCGKTTLLKTIAGLYNPDEGKVLIDGIDVTSKPAEERGIGFFFQHYFLFPHMTVRENVAYGLTVRGLPEADISRIVDEKLKMVGLSEWASNLPRHLSGGMQQRVALARALATGSKLLLLDEPLNALDAKIGALLRRELKSMAEEFGLTVIHVTPNQEEALELADRIILMREGSIVQIGCDVDCYLHPNSPFAAHFIGESDFIKARRVDAHTVTYRGALFHVAGEVAEPEVILAIRCEKIRFERHERNTLSGTIESVNFLGKTTRYDVNDRGRNIHVETSKHPHLKVGDQVDLYLPPEDLMVFSAAQPLDEDITVI